MSQDLEHLKGKCQFPGSRLQVCPAQCICMCHECCYLDWNERTCSADLWMSLQTLAPSSDLHIVLLWDKIQQTVHNLLQVLIFCTLLLFVLLALHFFCLRLCPLDLWSEPQGAKLNSHKLCSGDFSWRHVQLTSLCRTFSGETASIWYFFQRRFACRCSLFVISATLFSFSLSSVLFVFLFLISQPFCSLLWICISFSPISPLLLRCWKGHFAEIPETIHSAHNQLLIWIICIFSFLVFNVLSKLPLSVSCQYYQCTFSMPLPMLYFFSSIIACVCLYVFHWKEHNIRF